MAYPLYLTVRPVPADGDIPALHSLLKALFPRGENRDYLDGLMHPTLLRVTAERVGALSLLPSLLSAAGIDTEDLILHRDACGRPRCTYADGTPAGFDFNLSHTDAHVACALLVGGGRVGLDIEEFIRPERALPLIRRFCTEGERALLAGLPDDETVAARFFTSTWVEREAIAKQEGGGMPLRFDTTRLPEGITIWTGYLPDTETGIALCAPLENAPMHPRILPASLPVSMQ